MGTNNKRFIKELDVDEGRMGSGTHSCSELEISNFYQSLYKNQCPNCSFIEGLGRHTVDGDKAS